nr:CatA-like O-acetyltransferase [uncultured Schaedlerella sp.]
MKIDLSTWGRTQHYESFRNYVQPQYCVTFELDITHFLEMVRKQAYAFTFSFVFAVSRCANQIEEFPTVRLQSGISVLCNLLQ